MPAIEYGNFDLIQNNNSNRNLLEADPAVTITVAPGSSPGFNFTNVNRGDIDVTFGTANDVAGGVMITAVRENGRDNSSGGDPVKTEYVTPLAETGSGANLGRFFIPLETAPGSEEWNINTAAVYFPFNEGWLGGHTKNLTAANGGVQDVLTATSGISIGTHFFDNGGGSFTVNLGSLTSHGVAATSQNGVLLVTGQKNEDNFALSSDNANGSFAVTLKHNATNGAGTERDPIAFAYVPVAAAGSDLVTAVGRIQSDGSAEISGGSFTVTKLVETFPPVNTTGDTAELGFEVIVPDATGIAVGQTVTGDGIPADTRVVLVTGTTITLNQAATATASGVALVFTTPPGQGRWLLEIPGQSATTGTLIVTPCTGGVNNLDNIVSYEWDGTLGASGGWVIESRDLPNPEVLEDGATADEDMFNFVFFTTTPANAQPTVSITSPANGAEILTGNSVTITADAADTAPGSVVKVDFYLNGSLVATDTTAPYSHTTPVYNLPAGATIDVVAEDNDGARTYAPQVVYTVTPPAGAGGLYFNGVNEYAALGDPASLKLPTFTLETWFRRVGEGVPATTGVGGVTAAPLITKGREQADQSNLDMNYFLGIRADGVLVADFEDSNLGINVPVAGTTSVPLDEWHHVAATFDGTTWKLYLDGNLEATRHAGGLVPRADSIQQAAIASALNSTGAPAGYFNGYLDEVRIWNTARTQSQLRASLNFEIAADTGLVARWGIGEGSGAVITSSAAGSLVGNLVNAPFWSAGQAFTNNVKPDVAITSPADGSRFLAGAPILIQASANDPDGSIQKVEFFDNGVLLSTDTVAPFEFNYTNAPLGGYHRLTAIATDANGAASHAETVTVDVTIAGPALPGYSAGVVNGGDIDIDDGPPAAADPANWVIEGSTAAPRDFDLPGTDLGDLAINLAGSPVGFSSGVVLASNHSILGNLASTDQSLATYRGANGEYFLSTMDNEDPGAAEPLAFEESSRFSLGYFPYADGWIGANVDATGAVLHGSSNLPPGVTITNTGAGLYQISGLPTSGNLLTIAGGDGSDDVTSVAVSGSNWMVSHRDNVQTLENAPFGFVYIPSTARQVFSGQVTEAGNLVSLNDEISLVGASVNRGTQGYEIIIGDGTIINPSNSVLFITADNNVGPAGDNILSYTGVGNAFVVFSHDLPFLNGQFQAGGFRFLVAPRDPVAINGDEVVVLATDSTAMENSPDDIAFTFTRTGSSAAPLTVNYTVGGTATAGSDYAALPGSVTFATGQSSVVVSVSAQVDAALEPDETVSLTITSGTGYTPGVFNTAVGTIQNFVVTIPRVTVSFQNGVGGYAGQWDRRVGENGTAQNGSAVQQYFLDGMPGAADASEDLNGLIRFDNLFGTGPGQIPPGAEVTDARLTITTATVADAQSPGPWLIDRLMVPVTANTTYATLGGDPNPANFDGFEGARGASYGLPLAGYVGLDAGEVSTADVTEIVKAWADGEPAYGFSIVAAPTTNGWSINTSGNTNPVLRPKLEVTYTTLPVKDYYYPANRSAILNSQSATQDGSTVQTLFMDLNDPTTGTTESLMHFAVEFGSGAAAIPLGEEIVKAELILVTNSPLFLGSGNAQTGGFYAVHQMLTDWSVQPLPATRYGNLGPVVGTNIAEAAVRFQGMGQGATSYVDVTSIVSNWRGGAGNYGVNVKPETEDGWQPFFPGVASNSQLASAAPMLRIQTAIYAPSPFDAWASANGIPGSNLNEDRDRDGISALIEYALGTNPLVKNTLPMVAPDLSLTFTKGAAAAADPAVIYGIETSGNLVDWAPADYLLDSSTQISTQLPVNSGGKFFGRLTVDYNP